MTLCNVVFTFERGAKDGGAGRAAPRVAGAAGLLVLMAAAATLTCDGGGGTDPVAEPNRAPQPVGTFAPVEVFVGDSAVVALAGYFRDPDGDSLAHMANSSDAGVVAARVAGGVVVVRGVSQGAATVTVTATDPDGLSAEQTLAVAVPNRGPGAVGGIGDIEVEVGDSAGIGLPGHFTDPDGDGMVFTASSSDTSVAGVAVARDTLTVAALAKGAATVTVTARDGGGLEARHTFGVAVPNRAPVVIEGLPDARLPAGDTARTDVSLHFSDPDGDSLHFAATSSAPHIATARLSGTTLTVAALAADTATITVSATDPDGLAASLVFTVVVPNRAPEARGTIPDTTLTPGDTLTFLASRHFRDPDGDSLGYTVRTSRRTRVAATLAGDTLALAALSVGSSAITLTASDPDGLPATQRFRVTVEPPPRPDLVVDSLVADADSIAAGGLLTLTAAVRNRGEAEAPSPVTLRFLLSYDPRITTSDTRVDTVLLPQLAAGASDTATVAVAAPAFPGTFYYGACIAPLEGESDVRNNCSDAARVRVFQPNRAPEAVGAISSRRLDVDSSTAIGVSSFFRDADGDSLRFSATSSAPSVATASVSGSTVTVAGVAEGRASITVTARDPAGLGATQSFRVTVEARIAAAPDLAVTSFSASADSVGRDDAITLNATAHNRGSAPSSPATLRYYTSPDARISTADTEIGTARVGALAAGRSESASLHVFAPTDGGTYYYGACLDALATESDTANNCSAAFAVRVEATNRPPLAIGVVPSRAVVAGTSVSADVAGHFSDPDGDTLTYSATSSDTSTATATMLGSTLTVEGINPGTATITVAATDLEDLAATHSFVVSVEEEATPLPDLVVESPEASVADSIESGAPFTLSADALNRGPGSAAATTLRYYRSTDATITTLDAEVGTDAVRALGANQSSSETISLSAPSARGTWYYGACIDAVGNELNVSNNCSDGVGLRVWARNRPPRAVGEIADRSVAAGNSISLDVAAHFSDPDGDDLDYSTASSAPGRARVTNSGSRVTVTGVTRGSATITVTARDSGGLTATQTFDVVVGPGAQPDLVVTSVTVSADQVAPSASFTLTAVVRNQGTASLPSSTRVHFYRSADATITTADTEIGNSFVGELAASRSSTRSITPTSPATAGRYYHGACVAAVAGESDTGNNCSSAVALRVQPQGNRAPRAVGTIGDKSVLEGNEESVYASAYFSDPDGDALTYSATSSRPDSVSVGVNGDTVQFKGEAPGRSTITVTARDPGDLTATQSFLVHVTVPTNRAPLVRSAISDITDAEVGDGYHTSLSPVFTDPDGDDLTYSASNTNAAVATVRIRNDSVFVDALAAGSTTMSVTATDPGGLSATDSWDVTVLAPVPETFSIELAFTDNVTDAQKEDIRAARDTWESILAATELFDVTFNQVVECLGLSAPLDTVDDHVVFVDVTGIDGPTGTLARATYCHYRILNGVAAGPVTSAIEFDAADIERVRTAGALHDLALHEIAHGLGFDGEYWDQLGVVDTTGTDPHFTGTLAVAAFDDAGGDSYSGNKVPISSPDYSHWRGSVFDSELMTPSLLVGGTVAVSAITLQSFADIGYTVDVSLADDYDLPTPRPPWAAAEKTGEVLHVGNDMVRGPVMVVGPDGRTIRVIPPPPGTPQVLRGPTREARIEIRPGRDISNPASLRPSAAGNTFWRRDRNPADRPGSP